MRGELTIRIIPQLLPDTRPAGHVTRPTVPVLSPNSPADRCRRTDLGSTFEQARQRLLGTPEGRLLAEVVEDMKRDSTTNNINAETKHENDKK